MSCKGSIMKSQWCNSIRICVALLAMALMVNGCTDYDTNPPAITSENPILLSVSSVEVESAPDFQHPSPLRVAPEYLVKEWVSKKVQAVGAAERRFVVQVTSSKTFKSPNATSPKFDAYTTEINLSMNLYEPTQNLAVMQSNMMLKLTREVSRKASVPEREAFFAGMTRELVRRMDVTIPAHIEKYFSPYLIEN
jgi:hypothetical protein